MQNPKLFTLLATKLYLSTEMTHLLSSKSSSLLSLAAAQDSCMSCNTLLLLERRTSRNVDLSHDMAIWLGEMAAQESTTLAALSRAVLSESRTWPN